VKLRVEVTAEDIACGQRENPCACPIAKALIRAGARDPMVAGAFIRDDEDHDGDSPWAVSFDHDYLTEVRLPGECGEFASSFDRGLPVEPFTFEIEVPDTAVER
jgi:hypothetical protein